MVTKGQSGRGLCVLWAARNWSLAEAATSAVERTSAFDGIGRCVTRVVGRLVRSGPVKDLLSGPWLCHPTDPVLTDPPIGVVELAAPRHARRK